MMKNFNIFFSICSVIRLYRITENILILIFKYKFLFMKFKIIHKGILSYIFGTYDKKAFKKRLDKNVEYKM